MDDWTKHLVGQGSGPRVLKPKNEVAGAALRASGVSEREVCQKRKIFGRKVILFVDTNL